VGKVKTGGKKAGGRGLMIIGIYKIVEGVLLVAVGIGALRLLHKDVAAEAMKWISFIRVDPENVFIHRVLKHLDVVNDHKLKEFGIGTFIYAGLRLTEGIGLALKKRWAEYFTLIVTASFIPLEIWEIVKRLNAVRVSVLVINIVIVIYLWMELRRGREKKF
jgi:uncharacterized membrane protein (DUF2068 family)